MFASPALHMYYKTRIKHIIQSSVQLCEVQYLKYNINVKITIKLHIKNN